MKSNEELHQIAQDIFDGKIFSPLQVDDLSILPVIFTPLLTMKGEEQDNFIENTPAFVYEYLDKALPVLFTKWPMFSTMKTLNHEESDIMIKHLDYLNANQS